MIADPTTGNDELIPASTFWFRDEAVIAQGMLRSCGILCYLENEHTLSAMWTLTNALGGIRLMVPASLVQEARAIVTTTISEEEMTASAGAADPIFLNQASRRTGRQGRTTLGIVFLLSPAIERLRLFYL